MPGTLTLNTLDAQHTNQTASAAEFDGADLATKVQNALDALPNGLGRVIIPPTDDGTAWSWGSTLSLTATDYNGVHIECLPNAQIEYTGTGWCFDIDGGGGSITERYGGNDVRTSFSLRGGDWLLDQSGDIPGFIRLQDSFAYHIEPRDVYGVTNSTTDAIAVLVRNVDHFSEGGYISGNLHEVDIGVKFEGATVTGGSGTDSVNWTFLEFLGFDGIQDTGLWFDRALPYGTLVSNCSFWPATTDVRGVFLDADIQGMKLDMCRWDKVGNSGFTAIEIGSNNTFNLPLIDNPWMRVDTVVDSATGRVPVDGGTNDGEGAAASLGVYSQFDTTEFEIRPSTGNFSLTEKDLTTRSASGNAADYAFGDGTGRFEYGLYRSDGTDWQPVTNGGDRYALSPVDVTTLTSPQQGDTAYNDGTTGTEGLAAYDGSQWVSQVDGTTIS